MLSVLKKETAAHSGVWARSGDEQHWAQVHLWLLDYMHAQDYTMVVKDIFFGATLRCVLYANILVRLVLHFMVSPLMTRYSG